MGPIKMQAADIVKAMRAIDSWYGIHVPEFTYNGRRIDYAIINTQKRWIRGFEIKVSRSDFLKDVKWQEYTEFTSSLTLVCPEGLIRPEEVSKPFGLLYLQPGGWFKHVKKPKRFQRRDALAWLYTYTKVLEKELPRLQHENTVLKADLTRLQQDRKEGGRG